MNFNGADIQQADLSGSNVVNADLHKVKYCKLTKFPNGYPVPNDARDMDKELAVAEEEKKKKLEAQEKDNEFANTVIVWILVFFLIFVIVVAASGASDHGVSQLPPRK